MWEAEKKAVLEISRLMVESGLAVGTMGNVSVRLKGRDGSDLIAVTPSGCYCDMLTPADIVIVDFAGRTVEGEKKPSSELKLHIAVYQARPEVNAVVHTHSLYGSVLAVIGQKLPAIMDDQVFCLGGEIEVAPYALPGSRQLADNTVAALSTKNAVIIANHGTAGVGKDLRDAFTNCQLLEKTAQIYVHALNCGKVNVIPQSAANVKNRSA